MFQSTNEYTEKVVAQNLGDTVINQHQDICVKLCLTDILKPKQHGDKAMQVVFSFSHLFIGEIGC